MATYTTQQLITNAYYLSGIVSRGLQSVTGDQINDGLFRLNGLLAIKTANQGLIPYYRELDFNAVIGQEAYPIANLIEVETLTFNIGPVRYSILPASREMYFATGRVDNIQSLPYMWHFERTSTGGTIYIYFLPQQTYLMKLWGKFGLAQTTYNQDLSQVYESFYLEYLLYALAEYLCEYYNVIFSEVNRQRLKQYEQVVRDISPLDLSMQKLSTFGLQGAFNYADVNVGRGWRPVG